MAELETVLAPAIREIEAGTGVRIAHQRFTAHVAQWLRPDEPPEAALRLKLDQLWLARAAADGDSDAVAEIEAKYLERAVAALRSFERAVADEAIQRMRELLFVARGDRPPRIAEFSGRGDLAGWIRTTALREAFHLVAPTREVRGAELDSYALPASDPGLELMKRTYGASFKQALAAAFGRLPDATRLAIRRYYLDGMGLEEIAALEGVAASTVWRRLDKARRELHAETRRALAEHLRVDDDELDSILNMLDSRLELSRSVVER